MTKSQSPTHKRQVAKQMQSPVGTLTLVATDDGLAAILWENDRPGRVRLNIAAEESGTRCSPTPSVSSRSTLPGSGRSSRCPWIGRERPSNDRCGTRC